ncbi:right-handed parallel beta-helix repeat-containing protein [Luteimonas mephitis]|uniref:right-handed parallel beta-helix repeat-containing protein n=1 Tax=Luteimonas mephitis TaxID=83615 RepID=UPI00047D95A5|nr:right-handed parallel beta-helix repeat-containing protein [Luteimonas mephitis]
MTATRLLAAPLLIACVLLIPTYAKAAQSYDNCTNFIDSVPATISSQGVWCLRKDVSTGVTSGNAINIQTNNVTIDCNDFKLGGLSAGSASQASGIRADGRQNITVRNCNVRGFYYGILLVGGAGHLVEGNRLDNNLSIGIAASDASNSIVRGNRVYDTGGSPDNSTRSGIYSYGGDAVEVADNIVAGVAGTPGYYNAVVGIIRGNYVSGLNRTSAQITGNSISGLAPTGTGMTAHGFTNTNYGNTAGRILFAGNNLYMTSTVANSVGIKCTYGGVSIRDNNIIGFPTGFDGTCWDDGGNVVH